MVQGFDHKQNIIEYYKVMQQAAKEHFTEDNKPTLDGFLTDCHKEANNEIHIQGTSTIGIQPRNQTNRSANA